MLKKSTDDIGRVKVSLYKNNKHINKRVSILVAEAFIGPRPEGLYVLHGKRGVSVNIPENLSYGTPSKNQGDDRLRDGTDNRGEKNGRAKLTKDQVIRVKINKEKWTSSRWAEEFGVSRKAIRKIVAGETWGWLEP